MEPIDIISIQDSTPKLKQQLKLNLLLGLIYTSLLLGLLSILLLIPNSPSSSSLYKLIYFKSYFSPFKIFYFFVLTFSGKIFVQAVTLKNLLKTTEKQIGGNQDNLWLFICTFFAFVLGGNATLTSVDEETGYLTALLDDFCFYTLVFVLFIHSTYVISGALVQVNLSFGRLYMVSRKSFVVALVGLACLTGILGYQLYLLYLVRRLVWYVVGYVVVGLGVLLVQRMYRFDYEFNLLSVYCLILVPLTATPFRVSQVIQASLMGLFVENTSRVGFRNLVKKILN